MLRTSCWKRFEKLKLEDYKDIMLGNIWDFSDCRLAVA